MRSEDLNILIQNLPHIPGLLGKDDYFNSAVFIPLVLLGTEYHFIFEKRVAGIRQGKDICFPGGGFDPNKDKDYKDTAIRELMEELGVTEEQITLIGRLDTVVAPMGVTVDAFVGIVDVEDISVLDYQKQEVENIFSLPVSYFKENKPKEYAVRLEVQPSYQNEKGEDVILLPVKELGLSDMYLKPWGKKHHPVYLYETPEGIIWGLTANLIIDIVNHLS